MDHWADPWADDAAATPKTDDVPRQPERVQVEPAVPIPAPAPVLLSGFLDDAQWGSNDPEEDFGGWKTHTEGEADWTTEQPPARDENRINSDTATSLKAQAQESSIYDWSHEGWGNGDDNVVSEASDSATTVQADEKQRVSRETDGGLTTDDDLSTRPSTSPSDGSQIDTRTDSPRTSFEDELGGAKDLNGTTEGFAPETTPGLEDDSVDDNKLAEPVVDVRLEEAHDARVDDEPPEQEPISTTPDYVSREIPTSDPIVNLALIDELFPASDPRKNLPHAPDDPIQSTSARKAWYRLTRKQTMREFNSGEDENNYTRVKWANSRVRTDVVKIVARWANEDRISGRGPGGRASFFWDHPTAENQTPRALFKHKPTTSISSTIQLPTHAVQPINTSVPAAFSWSSATPAANPWEQSSPIPGSPVMASRPQSISLARTSISAGRQSSHFDHTRSMSSQMRDPMQNSLEMERNAAFAIPPPTSHADPWAGLDTLDQKGPAQQPEPSEEDDEWGDMVGETVEPTAEPTSEPHNDISKTPIRKTTTTTPSTTPTSARSSPFQPPLSKHASPIVRLKGVVSPTSSQFKSALVIGAATQMAIGPGLLKPTRKVSNPAREAESSPPSLIPAQQEHTKAEEIVSEPEPPLQTVAPREDLTISLSNDEPTAATQSSDVLSTGTGTTTEDPWSTADFSIFDNPSALAAQHPQPDPLSPSDPFSAFASPAPAEPFARPPPRAKTPPPLMPLTGASNSAQRRKAEEDEIIKRIVDALPDLRYMLI